MSDITFGTSFKTPFADGDYKSGLQNQQPLLNTQNPLLPQISSPFVTSLNFNNLSNPSSITNFPIVENSPSMEEVRAGFKHLGLGDSGASVVELQQKLNTVREKYNQIPIPVTGYFDSNTEAAVKDLHGYKTFDIRSTHALDEELATPKPINKLKAMRLNVLQFFGNIGTTVQDKSVTAYNYSAKHFNSMVNAIKNSTVGQAVSSIPYAVSSGTTSFLRSTKSFINTTIDQGAKIVRKIKEAILPTKYKETDGDKVRLKEEYHPLLDNLVQKVKSKGYTIGFNSSFRDNAEQSKLYNQAVRKYGKAQAGNWAAPPGKSKHNSGLAIDMNIYNKRGQMIPQKEFDRLISQAGFYRPMSWETWHIEPISTKSSRA